MEKLIGVAALGLASILFTVAPVDLLTSGNGHVTRSTLPWASVLRGIGGAAVIGLVAGLVPATLATRSSIVDAVRR